MLGTNVVPLRPIGLFRPEQHTLYVAHFDLAALWLTDHGWEADAGVFLNPTGCEIAGLSTNAPKPEVMNAARIAYENLRGFFREQFNFSEDELPLYEEMLPFETWLVSSQYSHGRVYGYA
jgi:hypothetical protein